jgi:hypothetical protein
MATADNDDIKFLWVEHAPILGVGPFCDRASRQCRAQLKVCDR